VGTVRARQLLGAALLATTISVVAAPIAFADEAPPDSSVPAEPGVGDAGVGEQGVEEPSTAETGSPDGSGELPVDPSVDETAHSIEVESVQIAVADTGHNQASTDVPATSTDAPSTDLATGAATAVGSVDRTAVGQEVVADVDDTSSIDVVQISIVFNIGGALASSGRNALAAGDGGDGDGAGGGGGDAAITSGSASAVGNDSASYVTQGARAETDVGESDAVTQRTATLRIGLAIANSGSNAISSPGDRGVATARTGDATAVGNMSTTAVTQLVVASGRDGARISVDQRATIINIGLAFADSGANLIGGALAAALSSTDEHALTELLMLLVPDLVATAERSTAAGSISTGDATAIGNRSVTEVLQVAVANGAGGSVGIDQRVVVVNAGAAAATTGGNAIGGPEALAQTPASLAAQAVVGELSTFLRLFLADIESWTGGLELDLGQRVLSTRLGDVDIGLDRTLSAQSTRVGSVTTRQLAAVVNLAIARADSGSNATSTGVGTEQLATALSTPDVARALDDAGVGTVLVVAESGDLVVITGNASATNSGLTVLCQRSNMADLVCLAPPEPPEPEEPSPVDPPSPSAPTAPTAPTEPSAVGGETGPAAPASAVAARRPTSGATLPATGGDPRELLVVAFVAVLLGTGLVVVTRRSV
jgi:hypothetical protein